MYVKPTYNFKFKWIIKNEQLDSKFNKDHMFLWLKYEVAKLPN